MKEGMNYRLETLTKVPEDIHGITKDDPIFKQLTPDYKLVFLLLLDRLKNEKRIKMSEFHDNKYLQRDIIDVIKKINIIREGMLSNPDNKIAILRADMFEGIFFDLVKNFKLLGEDFSAIMPCIYDDLFNGVDIILRENVSKRANSYIVAGIDLTIGGISYSKKLEAQINRVRRYDYSGNKVNYFKSEDNRFKGSLGQLPGFVLCIPVEESDFVIAGQSVDKYKKVTLNEIFAEYYQVSTGLLKTEDAKILKLTREFIIRTMLMQCDLFTKEAEREEVKSVYTEEKKRLEELLTTFV